MAYNKAAHAGKLANKKKSPSHEDEEEIKKWRQNKIEEKQRKRAAMGKETAELVDGNLKTTRREGNEASDSASVISDEALRIEREWWEARKEEKKAKKAAKLAQEKKLSGKRKRSPSPSVCQPPSPAPPASRVTSDQDDDEIILKKESEHKRRRITPVTDNNRVAKHKIPERSLPTKLSKVEKSRTMHELQLELKQLNIDKKLIGVRKLEVQREMMALRQQ